MEENINTEEEIQEVERNPRLFEVVMKPNGTKEERFTVTGLFGINGIYIMIVDTEGTMQFTSPLSNIHYVKAVPVAPVISLTVN